jgi:hypothetical protein
MLKLIDNDMMSITEATLLVFQHDNSGSTLDAKVGTGMSLESKVRIGAHLMWNDGMSTRSKNATIRDINTFASPFLR